MTKDSAAPTTATHPPPFPKACATESWTWASQLGSPVTAPLIAADTLPSARLAGSNQRIPMPPHTIAHTALPPPTPSGPSAAAGPATPRLAGTAPARGHTRRPTAA